MILRTLGAAALCSLSILLSGCGSKAPEEATASEVRVTMNIGSAEPRTLDPHLVYDKNGKMVLNAIYEPLIDYDPETGEHVPHAMERYEASEDGKTYTLFLRKDARWSNGDPVVAADWAAGFRRALSPEVSTPYLQFYDGVKNALAYNKGEVAWEEVGVKAIDDYTLQIEMDRPKLFFITSLGQQCFYPIHRPSTEAMGAHNSSTTAYFRPGTLIGNGPYILKEWTEDVQIVVEKNPYYHTPERIHLETVVYKPIEDTNTELRAFQTNIIDVTSEIPVSKRRQYIETTPPEFRADDLFGIYFFRLNVNKPPLTDPKVRKALAMSIDRYQIVTYVTNSQQPTTGTLVPPELAGYTAPEGIPEDVELAQKLLAEAGFPNGEGFPELTLIYNTSDGHRAIAQAVQQMWKTNLGVEIKLLNQEWKVFLQTVQEGDFDIARAGWVGGVDPEGYLDLYRTGSGNNHSKYSNPTFDTLFDQASSSPDPAKRMQLFQEAEKVIVDDAAFIPIYNYLRFYLLNPQVQNWRNNPAMELIFQDVQFGEIR